MRVKPDPNTVRYEQQVDPRAALVAALQRERRLGPRSVSIATVVGVGAGIAYASGRLSEGVAGFLMWVGFLALVGMTMSLYELFVLSERRRGQWQSAKIEERYVWKTTDVRDKDGDVTENLLFVLRRAPRPGERVADPHAIGKEKYIKGPGVLTPELIRVSGSLNRQEYLGEPLCWLRPRMDAS
jgi:hypothetical protein